MLGYDLRSQVHNVLRAIAVFDFWSKCWEGLRMKCYIENRSVKGGDCDILIYEIFWIAWMDMINL